MRRLISHPSLCCLFRSPHRSLHGAAPTPPDASFSIDPSRLPNTIPGVSQAELAARIERYQREMHEKNAHASSRAWAEEIETMRRAMPPDQFHKFVRSLDAVREKNAAELARLSAMTPTQLYRYQRRQRRRQRLREIMKTVWLIVVICSSVFCVFGLHFFFH